MKSLKYILLGILPLIFSCNKEKPEIVDPPVTQKEFKFTSSAFLQDSLIPANYTCDGDNISPALKWENAPAGTQSFALIMEDPDAPTDTFVHWIVYDIPVTITQLDENQPKTATLPNGAQQGKNGAGNIYYRGPCPPSGTHRYFFTLFALDNKLNLPSGKTKAELNTAMKGHILKSLQLVGKYQR
jgi:Raf kinase inhibitor-like YbhB/YbcL family protein